MVVGAEVTPVGLVGPLTEVDVPLVVGLPFGAAGVLPGLVGAEQPATESATPTSTVSMPIGAQPLKLCDRVPL